MKHIVTRFAPAPTGYLHLGHVLNAMYVWDIARASGPGARVLLRIEDHDRARSRPEFEAALLEDLAWLGFAADGELTRQSGRVALYERALDELHARGLTYGCECSRTEIGSGRYPGTCREKKLKESAGLGHPPAFLHHELLMKTPTQKLSKSDRDTGVRDLRAKGWSADAVIDRATQLAGLSRDQITDRASTSLRFPGFLLRSVRSSDRTRE